MKMTSKYAIINKDNIVYITLSEGSVSFSALRNDVLENVELEIQDKILKIRGDRVIMAFTLKKIYVSDMKQRPNESSIKKNIFGKEYVEGAYDTNKREKVEMIISNYCIEYKL